MKYKVNMWLNFASVFGGMLAGELLLKVFGSVASLQDHNHLDAIFRFTPMYLSCGDLKW
jgi:hypothetical protein